MAAAALAAPPFPLISYAWTAQQNERRTGAAPSPLSRQFGRWVAALRYEDLPPSVIDRAEGLTLHGLSSVLLGSQLPAGQDAVKFITEEEAGVRSGAAIMVHGTGVTKGGAAFANTEMLLAGGKWDTFRMLTHPGASIIPAAHGTRLRCRSRRRHPIITSPPMTHPVDVFDGEAARAASTHQASRRDAACARSRT
jgi:hypothetical protein